MVAGQLYQKIGVTTGYTSGYIWSAANGDPMDGNCQFDAYPADPFVHGSGGSKVLLCDYIGSTYVAPGDSGSPVFIRSTPPGVYFLGLIWGTCQFGGVDCSRWNTIEQIKNDLGALVTH
jgi:hypothetical protein